MRILLVHKSWRPGGGADQIALTHWRWLEEAGHDVIPFGMHHRENRPSPWSRYWVQQVDFERPTPAQVLNLVWSREAASKLRALVAETRPDTALLHNIYHQLSPSILPVLRRAGLRVTLFTHDYKLVCPNYRLYTQGALCHRCVGSHAWHAVSHRCLKDSLGASALGAAETTLHRATGAYRIVDTFVAPSEFMRQWLVRGGWPATRITVLPHAVDLPPLREPRASGRGDAFLYAGRLVPEKGLELLLAVARKMPRARFQIAGSGLLDAHLRAQAPSNVAFLGQLPAAELASYRHQAVAELVPSLWYEVFGLSALEAMAEALPVVASNVGGLPELIRHGETGLLVPPADTTAWVGALTLLWENPQLAAELGATARQVAAAQHSRQAYLSRLLPLLRGDLAPGLPATEKGHHAGSPV